MRTQEEVTHVDRNRISTPSGLSVKQYKHDLYIWRGAVLCLAHARKKWGRKSAII